MSGRQPAAVNFCLTEFARHGGLTGPHSDGWGIVYYDEDGAVRLFKEAEPASNSEWVRFIENHHLRSATILSHIRRATRGRRTLKNTQPFRRELGGRCHVFAHNGDIPSILNDPRFHLGFHRPLGETDSEYAFCALLGRLQDLWLATSEVPALVERFAIVTEFAHRMRELGMANFIYADSDAVFVHGNERRASPAAPPRPPGLYLLERDIQPGTTGFITGGLKINSPSTSQAMVMAASVPLTSEAWKPLKSGELLALRQGRVAARA